MITDNMQSFIDKNGKCKIIFGERRTKDDKPVTHISDIDEESMVRYRFTDGTIMTLDCIDIFSANYMPIWDHT